MGLHVRGVYGILFGAVLSTVIVPVPEEATLLAAGYAARIGRASLFGCIAVAWLAVWLGDCATFYVGRALLGRVLRTRVGRWALPEPRRRWAERVVARHAECAIVIARFLVGLRGFVYLAIGESRYSPARFMAIDGVVGLGEVGLLVGVGFGFGELRAHAGVAIDLVVAAILAVALFVPVLLRRARRRPGAAAREGR